MNSKSDMKLNNNRMLIMVTRFCLLFLCLLNFSCKKFTDVNSNNYVNLVQTAGGCQQVLDNYGVMNTNYPSDGEVSADDYFVTNTGYLKETLSQTDRDLYIWSANAIRANAAPQWQSSYNVIYYANLVMEAANNLKGTVSQPILDDLRGQALFFRAYALWQLAQIYAEPYLAATASQKKGIPVFLSSKIPDTYDRGNLQQTYDRIVQDLNDAVVLLSSTITRAPSRPSKTAAYAMLARVGLSMEDYTQTLNNSNLALQANSQLLSYGDFSTTTNTPFSRYNAEVIFQSTMVPSAILNPGTATNNTAKIDSNLVTSYDPNDLRGKLFLKPDSGIDLGTFRFSGNYEPSISSNFFNGLAVDEIYLIRAECYARVGNIDDAMTDLNTLLQTRWSSDTYVNMTATTADDALAKVLTERRKELLMRGLRWTDLRRLNSDSRFAKNLVRTVKGTNFNLPPNDLRYTLLIPSQVIDGGKSQIKQNDR